MHCHGAGLHCVHQLCPCLYCKERQDAYSIEKEVRGEERGRKKRGGEERSGGRGEEVELGEIWSALHLGEQ